MFRVSRGLPSVGVGLKKEKENVGPGGVVLTATIREHVCAYAFAIVMSLSERAASTTAALYTLPRAKGDTTSGRECMNLTG